MQITCFHWKLWMHYIVFMKPKHIKNKKMNKIFKRMYTLASSLFLQTFFSCEMRTKAICKPSYSIADSVFFWRLTHSIYCPMLTIIIFAIDQINVCSHTYSIHEVLNFFLFPYYYYYFVFAFVWLTCNSTLWILRSCENVKLYTTQFDCNKQNHRSVKSNFRYIHHQKINWMFKNMTFCIPWNCLNSNRPKAMNSKKTVISFSTWHIHGM